MSILDNTPDSTNSTDSTDSGSSFLSDHPGYLVAADAHAVANGQGSILDPSTWGDRLEHGADIAMAVATRAVVSAYNIVPELGNAFGLDTADSVASTENILRGFDDSLGDYYAAHQQGIDVAGDVIASFVPGIGGVKALNWAQKGLKMIPEGNVGYNMARSLGVLPDMSATYAARAKVSMATDAHSFSLVSSNVIKSIAAGYGQNALEFGVFEAAAAGTMRDSPLFKDEDAKDIMYNAVTGGGFLGAGIMGSMAAIKTYGGLKKAGVVIDAELAASRRQVVANERTVESDKIIVASHAIESLPVIDQTDPLAAAKLQTQQRTTSSLQNDMRSSLRAMAGDDVLGNSIADNLRGVDAPTILQNLLGAVEFKRLSDFTAGEAAEAKAARGITKADMAIKTATKVGPVPEDVMNSLMTTAAEARVAAAQVPVVTTKYLKLYGEGAGTVFDSKPVVSYLGDNLKPEAVDKFIASKKFSLDTPVDVSAMDVTHVDTEARTAWAMNLKEIPVTTTIGNRDLPVLERAYELGNTSAVLADGITLQSRPSILGYIEKTKGDIIKSKLAEQELSLDAKSQLTTTELAKQVNVTTDYLEGARTEGDTTAGLFAMQQARDAATQAARSKGITLNPSATASIYNLPQWAKISYDTAKVATNTIGDKLIDGLTYVKQVHTINRVATDSVFAKFAGDNLKLFVDSIPDKYLAMANRGGAGAKAFGAASADYGTLGAFSEHTGKGTAALRTVAEEKIADRFTAHAQKLSSSPDLGLELGIIRQQLLSTPEKYVLDLDAAGNKVLMNQKLSEWHAKGSEGEAPEIDTRIPDTIKISSDMHGFLSDWVTHNDAHLDNRAAYNIIGKGMQVQSNMKGVVYMPQPDPKNFQHWAMVIDPQVSSTGHKSMITAASDYELQQQIKKVPPQFRVLTKSEIDQNKLALGTYDFDAGINENYVDASLKRSGVAPFFPKLETEGAPTLVKELLDWRTKTDINMVRDMVALKYEREFTELQRMGRQATTEATSTFGAASVRRYAEDAVQDPYNNYVKTALDISKASEYKVWKAANNLAESAVGGLLSKITGMWTSKEVTPERLGEINLAIKTAGLNTNFEDAATLAYANHAAPKPALAKFVQGMNSVLSTLMLQFDPGNAINNAFGNIVLTGAETQKLLTDLKGTQMGAQRLQALAGITVPGTNSPIVSTTKLIGNAYANWFKALAGGTEESQFRAFYKSQGFSTSMHDQLKSIMDAATPAYGDTTSSLGAKTTQMVRGTSDFLEKWTGNDFAEEMNRFVASDIARQLSTEGVSAGVMTADEQKVFINSFVNRTQGNYLASQRPIAFQGPIGQSIGLFQTYQFNMLQHIFRRVEEGDNKSLAVLMGLQGSIYGINGLPAVNAINDHLIGNAAGNTSHNDIFSATNNLVGKEAGDWLMYGLSSNFLLNPDLKLNMYSRGDINPRQVTVIPTQLSDVPIVSASVGFFKDLYDSGKRLSQGADVYSTILQGIEHSGLNRPLAGIATMLESLGNGGTAYSTSAQGNLITSTDLLSLSNFGRLLGAKPLDEAVAKDAMYRIKLYSASRTDQINSVGEAIKSKVQQGDVPSPEEFHNFLGEYIKAGGDQHNFNKFVGRMSMDAKTSQANKIADNLKNPFSQYMQNALGGYRLEDMRNTPMEPSTGE